MVVAYSILLTSSLLLSKKIFGSIMTPLGLFGVIWNGLLALESLNLVYYTPISPTAHMLFIGSFLTFTIGVVHIRLLNLIRLRSKGLVGHQTGSQEAFQVYDSKILPHGIWLWWAMSALGLIWWLADVVVKGGFAALCSPVYFRTLNLDVGNRLSSYLISLSLASALLAGMNSAYGTRHMLRDGAVILSVPVIYSVVTGARVLAIWAFLLYLMPMILVTGRFSNSASARKSQRTIMIGLGALVALFVLVGMARSRNGIEDPLRGFARFSMPSALLQVYIYLTGPFHAFSQHLATGSGDLAWGQNLLTPLAKILGVLGFPGVDSNMLKMVTVRPPIFIPFWFNTYTYLMDWYADFGVIGILLGPYLLGTLSTWFFCSDFYKRPTALAISSLLGVQLVFSFTASITSFNDLWIAAIASLVTLVFQRRVRTVRRSVQSTERAVQVRTRYGRSMA